MDARSLLAGLAVLLALGCGGGDSNGPTSPTTGGANTVTVGNNFFSPATMTVPVGTAVTWNWAPGDVAHNVTFDDGQHSETQSSGQYQRTFTAAGTYGYHCTIHGAAVMSGTITVTSTGTTSGTGETGGTGGTGGSGMGAGYGDVVGAP
jgi:plastocyanin